MRWYIIFITAVAFFSLGLVGGIMFQQAAFQATLVKVVSNIDGVEINIDLNETQIMDRSEEIIDKMTDKMIAEARKQEESEKYLSNADGTYNCTGAFCSGNYAFSENDDE